jgi:hypothetical protein
VKVTYVTPSQKVMGLQRYLATIERITQVTNGCSSIAASCGHHVAIAILLQMFEPT